MASSKTDGDSFKDDLRRCVEKLPSKDGPVLAPFSGCLNSNNGASVLYRDLHRSNERISRTELPEKCRSPRQAAIGKQGGGVSKQHRRGRRKDIRILSTNERDFKALVCKHTSMPSLSAPDVMEPTSPQSNPSILTCRSLSQPASPKTPTSRQSKRGFNSPPMSPLSQPRPSSISPSRSDGKDFCVNRSAHATPQLSKIENRKQASHTYVNSSPDLYPHRGSTGNGVPQCASAPCFNNTIEDNQVGWPQGRTHFLTCSDRELFDESVFD